MNDASANLKLEQIFAAEDPDEKNTDSEYIESVENQESRGSVWV